MTFNINEISSAINGQNGLLFNPHYYVQITPNAQSDITNDPALRQIPFFCTQAQLPGLTLGSRDIMQSGYGIPERRPVNASFQDFTLSFICDGKAQILSFFQNWMQSIHNSDAQHGFNQAVHGLRVYEFQYPDKYEGTIKIYNLNTKAEQIIEWTIFQAYPMSMSDETIGWHESEEIIKVNVMFNYNWWTTNLMSRNATVPAATSLLYSIPTGTGGTTPPGSGTPS
jgi:hypothetical protein